MYIGSNWRRRRPHWIPPSWSWLRHEKNWSSPKLRFEIRTCNYEIQKDDYLCSAKIGKSSHLFSTHDHDGNRNIAAPTQEFLINKQSEISGVRWCIFSELHKWSDWNNETERGKTLKCCFIIFSKSRFLIPNYQSRENEQNGFFGGSQYKYEE